MISQKTEGEKNPKKEENRRWGGKKRQCWRHVQQVLVIMLCGNWNVGQKREEGLFHKVFEEHAQL